MSGPRQLIFAICLLSWPLVAAAGQETAPKSVKAPAKRPTKGAAEADPMAEVRRTTAILLVTSLADEARSFREPTLRARVQARAADALWETDRERARTLFRRAWEAAEAADIENERRVEEERRRQTAERGHFSIQSPPSLRAEVLRLAARRERALGEEFLAHMEEKKKEALDEASNGADEARRPADSTRRGGVDDAPPAVAKRLELARQLLDEGDTERALQFADPALTMPTVPAVFFLSQLRAKNAAAADQRFAALLVRAAADPETDANTISVLSSYLFTPGLFVRFSTDAGSNTSQWNYGALRPPTDVPAPLRASFFNTAALVLLRPIPPAEQDHTSAGRAGWYMVIARLLPLFDQFAPDKSAALRTQLAALTPDTPEGARDPGNRALTSGIVPEDPTRDRVQDALNRLNGAKSDDERDAIYADAVFSALGKHDPRLEEFIDKIGDADLRQRVRAYVDYERLRAALDAKDSAEALRIARTGQLPPIQRAWALTQVARLLSKKEPGRAVELLDEATAESRRIDAASPERVRALVAIATELSALDRPRAWEVLGEIVKAANAAPDFSGEDGTLSVRLQTKFMTTMMSNSAENFDLTGLFAALAKDDLNRAVELARAFQGESPRAVATLAVARAVLDRK